MRESELTAYLRYIPLPRPDNSQAVTSLRRKYWTRGNERSVPQSYQDTAERYILLFSFLSVFSSLLFAHPPQTIQEDRGWLHSPTCAISSPFLLSAQSCTIGRVPWQDSRTSLILEMYRLIFRKMSCLFQLWRYILNST